MALLSTFLPHIVSENVVYEPSPAPLPSSFARGTFLWTFCATIWHLEGFLWLAVEFLSCIECRSSCSCYPDGINDQFHWQVNLFVWLTYCNFFVVKPLFLHVCILMQVKHWLQLYTVLLWLTWNIFNLQRSISVAANLSQSRKSAMSNLPSHTSLSHAIATKDQKNFTLYCVLFSFILPNVRQTSPSHFYQLLFWVDC